MNVEQCGAPSLLSVILIAVTSIFPVKCVSSFPKSMKQVMPVKSFPISPLSFQGEISFPFKLSISIIVRVDAASEPDLI